MIVPDVRGDAKQIGPGVAVERDARSGGDHTGRHFLQELICKVVVPAPRAQEIAELSRVFCEEPVGGD